MNIFWKTWRQVLKRDGNQQEVKFDSITQRLRLLCDGHPDADGDFYVFFGVSEASMQVKHHLKL